MLLYGKEGLYKRAVDRAMDYPTINGLLNVIKDGKRGDGSYVNGAVEYEINNHLLDLLNLLESNSGYVISNIKFDDGVDAVKNIINFKDDYFLGARRNGSLGLCKYMCYRGRRHMVINFKWFFSDVKMFEGLSLEDLNVDLNLLDTVIERINSILFGKKIYITRKNGFVEYKSLNVFDMYGYLYEFWKVDSRDREVNQLFNNDSFCLSDIYSAANIVFLRENMYLLEKNEQYFHIVLNKKEYLRECILDASDEVIGIENVMNMLKNVSFSKKAKEIIQGDNVKKLNDIVNRINKYADEIEFIEYYCSLFDDKLEGVICNRFLATRI